MIEKLSRRRWLARVASACAGGLAALPASAAVAFSRDPHGGEGAARLERTALEDYEPRSMLHVPAHHVARARFPAIDFHTHISWSGRFGEAEHPHFNARLSDVLPVLERKNVRAVVSLTGGYGKVLEETVRRLSAGGPERFMVFTEPWYTRVAEANYPKFQAEQIARAREVGARGLKVTKTLGLYLRERVREGALLKVDDRRFDPMWEEAGGRKMPVAIHTSDPEAFFLPADRFNERYEELSAHPDWSFHGRDYPTNRELHKARNRVVARHPRTQFVVLHVGDAEDLAWVSEWLDRHPNMHVEIGARIGELGRQPRAARRFFERYQDRILFGTDAVPEGFETPQQVFGDGLYEIYFRFLETEDEYFDYAPAPKPPQGRWRIYGLGLPETILKKVYYENAARLLGLSV
ncbi:MAG TPA: amidohydrolase family protein [Pyrinomonadaceae bacterium]|nr:amidohydrolase family protein [Pyrinomonadaceae bacterium]